MANYGMTRIETNEKESELYEFSTYFYFTHAENSYAIVSKGRQRNVIIAGCFVDSVYDQQ